MCFGDVREEDAWPEPCRRPPMTRAEWLEPDPEGPAMETITVAVSAVYVVEVEVEEGSTDATEIADLVRDALPAKLDLGEWTAEWADEGDCAATRTHAIYPDDKSVSFGVALCQIALDVKAARDRARAKYAPDGMATLEWQARR